MGFNTKRTLWVGFGFMSICAFWQIYDGIVPLILRDTFGLDGAGKGLVMAADNILALVLLPLFGSLSDRTHTRLGRRMPYILAGTAGAVVSMLFIPLADDLGSLPLFVVGLGLTLLFMAVYRSPTVALMPDVTPKPFRSRGNAVINLMGTLGGILALLAINFLVPKTGRPDYLPLFAVTAGFMVLCVALLFFRVRENDLRARAEEETAAMHYEEAEEEEAEGPRAKPDRAVRRSLWFMLASVFMLFMGYNAVTTWFSTYATDVWDMPGGSFALPLTVAQAAAVAAYIPVGGLSVRIGRRRTILLGCVLLAASFGSCLLFRRFSPAIYGLFVLAGVGYAAIIVNNFPMIWEISRGGNVGRYTGYYYTMSMAAQIATPVVSSALMKAAGDQVLFPYACGFILLCFACMCFVRHGDARPVLSGNLLERMDVED